MTRRALLTGMAKPMPSPRAWTAVLMPTRRPSRLSRGPPLLPGLMAASVWTRSVNTPLSLRMVRPRAETTPVVTVWLKPKGLPMAMTVSPGMRSEESPRGTAGRSWGPWISSTARSKSGSAPLTTAGNWRPSCRWIMTSSPPAMTWALVSTRPRLPSTMTPEPRLTRFCRRGWSKPGPKPKNWSMGEMRWRSTTWVLVMLTTAGAVAWTARTTGVMRGLESGTGAAAGAVAVQSRARQAMVPAARRSPGNRENDGCMVNSVIVADGKRTGRPRGRGAAAVDGRRRCLAFVRAGRGPRGHSRQDPPFLIQSVTQVKTRHACAGPGKTLHRKHETSSRIS